MPGPSPNPSSNQGGAPVGQPVATCKQLFWIVIRLVREPYLKKPPFLKTPGDWWLVEPSHPYISEQFSAEITDGHKDAETDGQGGARYDDIPSGSCSAHFKPFYLEIVEALRPVDFQPDIGLDDKTPAAPPPPNYSVDLLVEKANLTLKHDHECSLEVTVTPDGATVDEYRIEIKRTSGGGWCTLEKNSVMAPWIARIAGKFKLRGVAKINGKEIFSAEKDVEVQFPTYSQIVGDPEVQASTDDAWCNTLNDCTSNPNQRREYGFWIRLNTVSDAYESGPTVLGPFGGPNSGASVNLPPRPPDVPASPAPADPGATYYVASFHTHTPTEFRTGPGLAGSVRPIGPSGADNNADNNDDVSGIVYDFVESPAGSGSIPMGHPKTSAAQLYFSAGKTKRTTP